MAAASLKRESVSSKHVRLNIKTMYGEAWDTLSIELITDTFDGEDLQAIEIWSTNLALLKLACSDLDELVEKRFPAMSFEYVVWFKNEQLSSDVLEWTLEGRYGSLASIMTQRLMNLEIGVRERDSREEIKHLVVADALSSLPASFFLSHDLGDWSVREASIASTRDGLQHLFELLTGELVWTDAAGLAEADSDSSGAHSNIVCLSRLYLTRPNCLRELCWAIEDMEAHDKPLLVVSVDPGVSSETVGQWRSDRDLVAADARDAKDELKAVTVDRRTVAFVQKHLRGVKIYQEWQLGEGSVTEAKKKAVEEMLQSIKNRQPRSPRPSPILEVRKEDSKGDDWWYIHEG
jgi:hypothetical protein